MALVCVWLVVSRPTNTYVPLSCRCFAGSTTKQFQCPRKVCGALNQIEAPPDFMTPSPVELRHSGSVWDAARKPSKQQANAAKRPKTHYSK